MKIELIGVQTTGTIEGVLRKKWASSLLRTKVVFDLHKLESIGFYPSTLLLSWCAALVARGVDVRVDLPEIKALKESKARLLVHGGVLRSMAKLGIRVDFEESSDDTFGVPIEMLSDVPISEPLKKAANAIRRATSDFPEDIVRDFCDGALFELLENASIHGLKAPHFGVHLFTSGAIDPFYPSSLAAERYLEMTVGDVGDGIQALLSESVPENYVSPFPMLRPLTTEELTLAYAFEFSSTSNAAGRRQRLHEFLVKTELDYRRVATGLSCVLNIVRTWQGQLIVRTPGALLSIDYARGRQSAVRTATDLFESESEKAGSRKNRKSGLSLAPLPGTHFFLRLPARRVASKSGYTHSLPGARLLDNIDVLAPFPEQPDMTEVERVTEAIETVDRHVRSRRLGIGLTVIRPSRVSLTARAKALFGAALVGIHRGDRHLLCVDLSYTDPAVGVADTYTPPAASDVGVILETRDLFVNNVRSVRVASLEVPDYLAGLSMDGVLRINDQIIRSLQVAFARHIRGDLAKEFKAPHVRLANGPFLIEGQYFTNVFFSVATALSEPYLRSLVVQWAAMQVPVDTEAIIVATAPVDQIANRLQALLASIGINVEIIRLDDMPSPHAREKKAVALTDVIARGNVLDAVLQSVQPVFVSAVVALVDARDESVPPEDFSFQAAGTIRHAALFAILREHLRTFANLRDAQRARRREQAETARADQFEMGPPPQVQVIDPDTHRPTVYVRNVRPTDPAGDPDALLRVAQRGKALLVRHVVHQKRHYAVFLHFPSLFRELRSSILSWMEKTVPRSAARRYLIANVDGSLDWLEEALGASDPDAAVRTITWNDLRAPDPPEGGVKRGLTIAVIPGSAGGETARRAIELASRGNPADLLLLIVLARMEPAHLAFLESLPSYNGSRLRVECFGRLPIRAYPDALACPLCAAQSEIEKLLIPESRLRDVAKDKIATMAPMDVSKLTGGFAASDEDVTKARLRASYEAAEYDLDVRQKLTSELEASSASIDSFLEVVAAECKSRHFSLSLMRRRLLKTFDRVIARVHEILWTTEPPYTLAPKIPGILHLIDTDFVIPVPRLLRTYARSKRDFEEICIALALLHAAPAGAESLLSEITATGADDVDADLLTSTIDALSASHDEAERFVADFDMLRQCLVNSSLVTVRLPALMEAAMGLVGAKPIHEAALLVYDGWTVEVATLLARLMQSSRWRVLAARHSALQETVLTLARRMNEVHQLAYKTILTQPERAIAGNLASLVKDELALAINEIRKLRVQPTRCPAIQQDGIIITDDNRRIRFESRIDHNAPFVFSHMESLNEVIAEIVQNWGVHNEKKDGRAKITIRSEGEFVVIELADDLAKPIEQRKNVKGGVSMFHDYCRDYCGRAEVREAGPGGMKSVLLYLRALPEEKKEPKWMTN